MIQGYYQSNKSRWLFVDGVGVYNNLGFVLKEMNRLEAAEAAYRRAIELDLDNIEAYNNMGALLTAKNQPVEAAFLSRAMALNPGCASARDNLGITQLLLEQYDL